MSREGQATGIDSAGHGGGGGGGGGGAPCGSAVWAGAVGEVASVGLLFCGVSLISTSTPGEVAGQAAAAVGSRPRQRQRWRQHAAAARATWRPHARGSLTGAEIVSRASRAGGTEKVLGIDDDRGASMAWRLRQKTTGAAFSSSGGEATGESERAARRLHLLAALVLCEVALAAVLILLLAVVLEVCAAAGAARRVGPCARAHTRPMCARQAIRRSAPSSRALGVAAGMLTSGRDAREARVPAGDEAAHAGEAAE